jgi:hypothetical protein
VEDFLEKAFLPILHVTELMAQDPEGTGGVAKPPGGFCRREAFDEIGPQSLVLAM